MPPKYHVGQRVSFGSALCTVRYIGPVEGTGEEKEWLGVEWDDPTRLSGSQTAGSFVRSTRPADPEQSFVEAVHEKYATEITTQLTPVALDKQIEISGKVVEKVGFDKIRKQLAQLNELKIVLVDGLRINCAEKPSRTIRETCPKIVELDLSRNLFEDFEVVVHVCGGLDNLRTLKLNGNRFAPVNSNEGPRSEFDGVRDLELDDILVPFPELVGIARQFPSLKTLTAESNYFTKIPCPLEARDLVSLTLDYNKFTSLSDLSPLACLDSLETLHLKGNDISKITPVTDGTGKPSPTTPETLCVFGAKLQYVDLSYNAIDTWEFVDALPSIFPGLTALRLSHNPIYEGNAKGSSSSTGPEEAYMFAVARLKNLKALNFSTISTTDRTNAEMFYLSRIAKAMAEVPESEEYSVIAKHPRYADLCDIYGPPVIVRKVSGTIDPNFLEARLINFQFYIPKGPNQEEAITKEREIPITFDIYRVKGIVGKMFGIPPLKTRLIWETGQWDPVAGYEEEGGSDDEWEGAVIDAPPEGADSNPGKWMEREVEIVDSTRQIGFCVDGNEVKVRVELRQDYSS
ncbi:uncharacterized protein BP5553_02251 [Venustampulla echinocandica]|uniref:CAP-Gly domain-containing protein n=1 Tax=Venustampulla echinocandica TaxID=2656787 RepID=A0A370U3C9_9HELO|nr:uncharacterized protein BP5553_02251 [Venustampulla echinocandica]RDL42272.1 hypothetical protein BP5553_02251 [Venustampulla echinocandica]